MFQSAHAHVTLLHGSVFTIPGHIIRTGRFAGAATGAFVPVDDHDSVPGSLKDGSFRANGRTCRFCAMHAGKGDGLVNGIWKLSLPEIDHSSPAYSGFNAVPCLTGDFTGVALDAAVGINEEAVLFCHY